MLRCVVCSVLLECSMYIMVSLDVFLLVGYCRETKNIRE